MKSHSIFLFILSLIMVQSLGAQTAVGGCSTVTLTSVPSYTTNLIIAGGWSCQACNGQCLDVLATSPPSFATTRNWLEQKQANGTWTVVQGGTGGIHGDNVVFNVSVHGTYRIRNQKPRLLTTTSCPSGRNVQNIIGQLVGKRGTWASFPTDMSWSNEVVVGATVQSDVAWNFIDVNSNDLFSPGEQIKMNTTNTKNYEHWWVAVFENGGQNRYWSNGWTAGPIPGNQLNLSTMCSFGNSLAQIPVSYTVQFAISASCNTAWTNLDKNFSICPAGLGCRIAEEEKEISFAPNPVSNSFHFINLPVDAEKEMEVKLTDMSGRQVKSFGNVTQSEFDVSDLDNGLYIVTVWEGQRRIFSSKLSVVK